MSAEASAETMGAAEPMGAAEAPATTATTAATAATGTAATAATAGTPATAATTPATAAPGEVAMPVARRRLRATAIVLFQRLLRWAVALTLFGAGVTMGWRFFIDNQPVVAAPIGDPAVVGNPAPAIVVELANAIAADDSDAIRAALVPEIFSNYTADLQNFGIVKVEGVETLGTYVDGPRSATVLVIHGRGIERNAFTINLVVQTENGQIVRLR